MVELFQILQVLFEIISQIIMIFESETPEIFLLFSYKTELFQK